MKHKIFISILVIIVLVTFFLLLHNGISYYRTDQVNRFYHPDNTLLKSSGLVGHGFGITGTLLIIFGVASYMVRKRLRSLARVGTLKIWLEIHIFCCTLGPILVLYHTSFKFGGVVAISFWSMVAVFLSGIIGRFIYIQIPRTIEGRELSLNEVSEMKTDVAGFLKDRYNIDEESFRLISESLKTGNDFQRRNPVSFYLRKYFDGFETIRKVNLILKRINISASEHKRILSLVRTEIKLNRKISQLDAMQRLFEHWHVAHLPFAFVMLVILAIHVAVTVTFGYTWIF